MTLYPWRRQSLEYIDGYQNIIWTDQEAQAAYPEFAWVYDKLEVSKRFCQSLSIDLTKKYPQKYPAIIKPKSKLLKENMVFVAYSKEEIDQRLPNKINYIAQIPIKGEHITRDYFVKDGKILHKIMFLCHRDQNNSFYLYERVKSDFSLNELVVRQIGIQNGVVNVETIGGVIVNIHLTPTIGVHDLSNFCAQLDKDIWEKVEYKKGYSRIFRIKKDHYVKLIKPLPKFPEQVSSVCLCFDAGKKLSDYYQDESSYRYMTINGTDLDTIEEFAKQIDQCLEFNLVD